MTVTCEQCSAEVERNQLGAPRRFCDPCGAARERRSNAAWKQTNPDKVAKQQRDRRARRRAES